MVYIVLVTLVHNRSHLVGLSLQSAVNQTLSKDQWVHLVIDNASSDGADKVAEVFCSKHTNMYFVKMGENLHQMPAYNWALGWIEQHYPDAEIMAQLDSDDELVPIALQEVKNIFDTHKEIGMTYSGFDIINKSGKVKVPNHPKAKMVADQFTPVGQRQLRKLFVNSNPIGHFRCMRIKCLKEVGGFDESKKFATDFNMAGKMLEKFPVVKIPKVLYRWRQHDIQVERQHSPEQTKNWQDLQHYYKTKWTKTGLI